MNPNIRIVDRGRGPQLSTSRVTVQDLVPYFQEGSSTEEILRWVPSLSGEEIAAVHEYYLEHKKILDEEAQRIQEEDAQRETPQWMQNIREQGRAKMKDLKGQFPSRVNGEAT